MKYDKRFQIEKAMSTDKRRHVLMSAHLDTDAGQLIATDGRQLAVIAVKVDKDDTSGPVHVNAIKTARKEAKNTEDGLVHLQCNGGYVIPATGATLPRTDMDATYPNYKQVIPPENPTAFRMCFNPEMLLSVAQAIGHEKGKGVVIEVADALSPIRVTMQDGTENIGILMPVRFNGMPKRKAKPAIPPVHRPKMKG